MKSNWIKYLFIVFVIILLVFAVYIIKKDEQEKKQEQEYTANVQENKVREIKVGIAELDTINPILSNNKNVQQITKLIYEPLVDLSVDYKATPCLAKEWAKQSDNSYLIKLKENVRWSNGQSFTADDVQFTIDRLKDTPTIYSANVQDVTGVEIIDDFTVKIMLGKEVPFFEYNLTFPILSKEYYQGEDFTTTTKNTTTVGTGEFKITDVQSSYITLEKNANWWNKEKEVTLDKIIVNLYSSVGELYNSFKIGNLDAVATDNTNIQNYIGSMGYTPKEVKGRDYVFLALNNSNSLLQKQEIRKAISYSIDKENITSNVLNNKAFVANFPLDYGNWLYTEESSNGYNADQGKQVLVDAGWSYKNKMWQKADNKKIEKIQLNLLVRASDQSKVAVAQNIKQQLEEQGIRINIVQAQDGQYNDMMNKKSFDMALCSVTLSPSPNLELFFGDNNLSNYYNEEVANIIKEVKNTSDENILKEKYKRLAEIYKNDVPYISLYNNKYTVAYNSELVGDLTPNWFNMFYGVEGWYK